MKIRKSIVSFALVAVGAMSLMAIALGDQISTIHAVRLNPAWQCEKPPAPEPGGTLSFCRVPTSHRMMICVDDLCSDMNYPSTNEEWLVFLQSAYEGAAKLRAEK